MKWVNTDQRIPIKSWCENVESSAMEQAINLSLLPFAYHHIALMPDAHMGFGMPIGGIMCTNNVVIPNCVGVDIGCGVMAVKTNIKKSQVNIDIVKSIMGDIRETIPVGFKHHENEQSWSDFDNAPDIPIVQSELNSSRKQLGTLGGGNHFWELQYDEDNYIWIMLHSGSRNFGFKIAKEYHRIAKELCETWKIKLPTMDLSYLPLNTQYADEYLSAMNFALEFARQNRRLMMSRSMDILLTYFPDNTFVDSINIHHNYAVMEHHFGKNVMVHRKGATLARDNLGIIPGSQGTASYIVKGKSNPDSFCSCSHGAGRLMGRKQAKNELNLDDEIKLLDDQGIIHSIRSKDNLDEAAGAYKDINEVMESQSDLVDIVHELKPMAVIKG